MSLKSQIALNSSYPKNKLLSNDPMITNDCSSCENWTEKDIIYIIGAFQKNKLRLLWMIYGDCYAAKPEYYTRIKNKISIGINEIKGVEFSETKELGRVNKVDPLGITYLRIRGMWGIDNPIKVYNYLNLNLNDSNAFQLIAIIPEEKYLSFSSQSQDLIASISDCHLNISKAQIKSPNNPAKMIDVRIVNYTR
ncbi:MAG: NgoPII family restriction endonuclease [Xenococcaceae cyanobacterium MO_167.B27]|nr:NgoPII family restriction endonuclease [Xenococcaceae cyanobacterium MO_167.B27]